MFVVWRSRERKLKSLVRHSARLVESVRVNGKPRQTFVSFLGSYEEPTTEAGDPNPAEALDQHLQFWRSARAALDVRGIHGEDRARIEDALAQRIPPPGHAFEDPHDDELPEPMSPGGPGDMPLYCAAHWIATKGRSAIIKEPREEDWRRAYGELRARIWSDEVKIFGDRDDGFAEQVPGELFSSSLKVVYPFQDTPLDLILGHELYLCCKAYIEEKDGRLVSGDTLRHGRVDRWRHLVVSKSDVLRYWPIGVNEPTTTQARNAVEDALKPPKPPSKSFVAITQALKALWPKGIPDQLRIKERDGAIIDWCRKKGHGTMHPRTINRYFKAMT